MLVSSASASNGFFIRIAASDDADISFGNESAHDSAAKDLRPDLYVMHIIGGTIREPSASDVLDMDASMQNADQTELDTVLRRLLTQHRARCGIKTVHTCKILIGELKPLPSRRDAIQSNIALGDEEGSDGLNGDDLSGLTNGILFSRKASNN